MLKILAFASVFFFIACRRPQNEVFYTLVNENFFTMVDTGAYTSGSLIQGMTEPAITRSKFLLRVDTVLENSDMITESVSSLIKESHHNFRDLPAAGSIKLGRIDTRKFTNSGKFELIKSGPPTIRVDPNVVGTLSFSQPYISDTQAIIVYSISTSPKSGYTNALFFQKSRQEWKLIDKNQLEIW